MIAACLAVMAGTVFALTRDCAFADAKYHAPNQHRAFGNRIPPSE